MRKPYIMRWFVLLFTILATAVTSGLPAQEAALPEWDFDLIFTEPAPPPVQEPAGDAPVSPVAGLLTRRGFTFETSYAFVGGIAPGWYEAPWHWYSFDDREHYFLERVIQMQSFFTLDSQITNYFRVRSTIFFEIPGFSFRLGDFFFDYNFFHRVFVRAGRFNMSWGISPNYNFTNLLARIPDEGYAGDSFIFRADIPSGIGGFQMLALTRVNLLGAIDTTAIRLRDIGFGARYNFAVRQADLDFGMFFQQGMPLRSFLSASTNFWNIDWYTEGMLAFDLDQRSVSGAANIGFSRDFFGGNLSVNGELFYNAEGRSYWFRPETGLRDAAVTPFIEGFNGALNLLYRFLGRRGEPRLFLQANFAPFQNTGQLIPGFRMTPWHNIELYFAMPMALGSRYGFYYENTFRRDTLTNRPLPFSIVFLVSVSGAVQFRHYY